MVENKELKIEEQPSSQDKTVQKDIKQNTDHKTEKVDGIKKELNDLTYDLKEGIKNNLKSPPKIHKQAPESSNNHPRKEELRSKVLEYIKENPNDFDICDQELLKTSDLWINRFLNWRNQSFENAYKHLIETFKWRKEFEVNTFDKRLTPIEAYMSGGVFIYLPDKCGNPVLYLRGKMHYKIEERFYVLFQKLLCMLLDNIDRLGNKEFGWTVVLDCNNVGWANIDLEMLHFLLNTARDRYPNGCKLSIIHGLPWFLNFIAKGVFAALPSDSASKVRFVSGKNYDYLPASELVSSFDLNDNNNNIKHAKAIEVNEEEEKKRPKLPIEEYIDIDHLPDFLGGRCRVNYRILPKGSKTAEQIGKTRFKLSDEKLKQLTKPFQKIIDEAHKTLGEYRKTKLNFEFDLENLEAEFEKYKTQYI